MAAGIKIENLNFSYNSDKKTLNSVSLEIKAGEKFGIIGPSGSGKSTLLLHLNGVLQAECGKISIGDLELNKKNLSEIRKIVGLVFQNPDDQLFNPTVEEDVAFGPINFGLTKEEVMQRLNEALEIMNLKGFEKRISHHLSIGERKRVALATVLSMKPEVIAFDEPFSNLDPSMVLQLIDYMSLMKSTQIIVSQSVLPLISLCDRLAILKDGEIIKIDKPKKIVKDRNLMESTGLDMRLYRSFCDDL